MMQPVNILIIDDNIDDRELYIRALKKATDVTYLYSEAETGQEGLERLSKRNFDCVLLDYSLPGINGLEVLRSIRMRDTFLPVIFLTGQGNEAIAVDAIKKGAHDYLNKSSVNTERLHYTIQSAISQGRLRQDIVAKDAHIREQTAELEQTIAQLEMVKQQQEQLIAKLMDSNSELERFAYICSHDLQEPLRMISNYTQRLELHLGKSLNERGRHYMLYITDGVSHARRLIRDVLDYARLEHEPHSVEHVSGEDVLWNVKRDLTARMNETGAQITHTPLPWVQIDATHLRQIFQNLINNGLKFNERTPQIHIEAIRENGFWHFAVQDNGIGIAPEHQDKIFEIFQRLNPRDTYPGSGIGLALCKKLVQKYGGNMWVESALGKGSTFHFTLPAETMNFPQTISAQTQSNNSATLV